MSLSHDRSREQFARDFHEWPGGADPIVEIRTEVVGVATCLTHKVEQRVMVCLSCGRVASIDPECVERPICMHSWAGSVYGVPEIWDGNDTDGEGCSIERVPNEPSRVPGPTTWTNMVELKSIRDDLIAEVLGVKEVRVVT